MKTHGVTTDYVLSGISWRRPGVLEVSVSCIIKADEPVPSPPKSLPLRGNVQMQLIEKRIEGFPARTVTYVYRQGKKFPNNEEFWSMDVSLMQVPITSHPNLKKIMDAGQGVLKNGEVDWPRYINGQKNTWYGTTSFLFPSIVVTKEEVKDGSSKNISFPEADQVGHSSRLDQGGFPGGGSAGAGRSEWILESHSIRKVGDEQRRETKVWRHGGVLGWADQIYKKGYFP